MNENEDIVETLTVEKFVEDLGLEVIYNGRGNITFNSMSVCRPGLQLAGFFNYFDSNRVQVIGNAEYEYLKGLENTEKYSKFKTLMECQIPCIILSRDLPIIPELMESAKEVGCPILRSNKTTTILSNDIVIYLNRLLAPSQTMHGVLVDVYGVGILLCGNSGIGKSETALELIKGGHRLVADDSVIIKNVSDTLIGTSPEMIRHFMEIRGVGIIDIRSLYGSGSVLNEKEIELVVELEKWEDGKEYDRIGERKMYSKILGVKIPKLLIPVRPGRNLAIIMEVAARNYRLKSMGYDAAQELIKRTIGI